jgi:hypothetical protein
MIRLSAPRDLVSRMRQLVLLSFIVVTETGPWDIVVELGGAREATPEISCDSRRQPELRAEKQHGRCSIAN